MMAVMYKVESSLAVPVCFHFASPEKNARRRHVTFSVTVCQYCVQSIGYLLSLGQYQRPNKNNLIWKQPQIKRLFNDKDRTVSV